MAIKAIMPRPSICYSTSADGGPHSTPDGTTELSSGVVGPRRVRLHDQITGAALREVWSHPVTGAWQVKYLRAGRFYAVAFDHTGVHGAVCESDIVLPAPPPAPEE